MGTKNSTLVSNFEATPPVMNDVALLHGVMRVAQGTVALAAGDSDDNDIVMLAPIPSNASIAHIFVGSDTLGGSCTFNVGIYTDAGVVKDEDVLLQRLLMKVQWLTFVLRRQILILPAKNCLR